jgi:hypothetical protein
MSFLDYSGASATKGRPKGSLGHAARSIRGAVLDLTTRFAVMTVRQIYYQLEATGVVAKSESGYRQVQRQVLAMRRERLLPWDFVADGTRWMRKASAWDDLDDYLQSVARGYRRDLWQRQDVRIEIWLEKDALAGVLSDVTNAWGVSLMVSRGQSSATFLHSAAKEAEQAARFGIATYVYALYDLDAGGNRAAHAIEHELPRQAPGVPIYFERLAVTQQQVQEWSLPTRPANTKDPDAAKNLSWAVDLDAIPPDKLTELVEDAIRHHIDVGAWEIEQTVEEQEREGLLALAQGWRNGAAER